MGWKELPQSGLKGHYLDEANEDKEVFRNKAMETSSKWVDLFMISYFFHSLVFDWRQATISLSSPGKYNFRNPRWMLLRSLSLSVGRPKGRNNTFHGFMYNRNRDGARGRNPGFPASRNTPNCLFWEAKPLPWWYLVYRKPLKRETILTNLQWFHSPTYTWHGGETEYCPHHALMSRALDLCYSILSRWILMGGSTVRNDCACWWVLVVKRRTPLHCDICLYRWIEPGE